MQKQFFKGLSLLVILNLLVKPVWIFFVDRQVQNIVGHTTYGTYFALLNLSLLFSFVSDAGLSNYINRQIAAGKPLNIKRLLLAKLLLIVLYLLTCCAAALLTGISDWNIFLMIISCQVLGSIFIFLRSMVSAQQLFATDAWLSTIDKFLMIVMCSGFIYGVFRRIDIILFLQLQVISTAIAIGIAVVVLFKMSQLRDGFLDTGNFLKKTWPFAIIILLMSVHYRADGFLLYKLHPDGSYQSGLYAAAYRLLDAANVVGYLAASFLLPFMARHAADSNTIKQTSGVIAAVLLNAAVLACSFAAINAAEVQRLLYKDGSGTLLQVMPLVLAALPAYYLVHIYGTYFTAVGAFRMFIRVLLVSVTLNLVLNPYLIPVAGAVGAAIAAVVSQYTCAMLLLLIAGRHGVADVKRVIAQPLITFVSLLVCFSIAKHYGVNAWFAFFIASIFLLYMMWQMDYFRKNLLDA